MKTATTACRQHSFHLPQLSFLSFIRKSFNRNKSFDFFRTQKKSFLEICPIIIHIYSEKNMVWKITTHLCLWLFSYFYLHQYRDQILQLFQFFLSKGSLTWTHIEQDAMSNEGKNLMAKRISEGREFQVWLVQKDTIQHAVLLRSTEAEEDGDLLTWKASG